MAGLWFYAKPGSLEKAGPVSEEELRGLISSGQINGTCLVWTEGMENWAALNTLPQWPSWSGTPATTATPPLAPPASMAGWMTFLGVVHIVLGVISIATCFGAINGILLLVCGTALLSARAALQTAPPDWPTFLTKLNTFLQVTGIMYILAIASAIIGLLFFFSAFSESISQMMR